MKTKARKKKKREIERRFSILLWVRLSKNRALIKEFDDFLNLADIEPMEEFRELRYVYLGFEPRTESRILEFFANNDDCNEVPFNWGQS